MTMGTICVLAILAFFWAGCATTAGNGVKGGPVPPDEAKARAHLSLGAAHLRNGRLSRALKELLDAEKYDPQNADVQSHIGLAYKELKKYPLAVQHLKKALALRKNFPEAHNSLGTVYLAMKMYAEALTEFNITLSDILYTTPQYTHFNVGQVYLDQGLYDQALAAFKKSVEITPGYSLAYNSMGRTYLAMNNLEDAVKVLKKAVEYAPNYAIAFFNLAEVYLRMGQREKARENFKKVIEIAPMTSLEEQAKNRLAELPE